MSTTTHTPGSPTPGSASPASHTPTGPTPATYWFNPTFLKVELLRVLRDPVTLFFTTVMPGFMYVIFGWSSQWGDFPLGLGNVSMSTMVAMAAFGALIATSGVGGWVAVERAQGWGRQLALTPMHDATYIVTKCVVAVLVALVPITVINVLGMIGNAQAPTGAWITSFAITAAGSAIFALFGLALGLALRSEAALAASGGVLSILGFLGNVFVPLSGTMLAIARFTPLYGYVALAKYPITQGQVVAMDGTITHEPLWWSVANVGAWTLILVGVCLLLARRGQGRP